MAKQADTIRVRCPKCGREILVSARLAGRQFRCPNGFCSFTVTIPGVKDKSALTPVRKRKFSLQKILRKAFRGKLNWRKLLPKRPAWIPSLAFLRWFNLRRLTVAAGVVLFALILVFPPAEYGEAKRRASPTGEWTHIVVRRHRGFIPVWSHRPNKRTRWQTALLIGGGVLAACSASYYIGRRQPADAE